MHFWSKILTKIISALLICILLTGCGDISQPAPETAVSVPDSASFSLRASELPAPEDALTQEILKEDNWMASRKALCFWNGSNYVLSDLFEMVEGDSFYKGVCIQVLESPYDHWENYVIFYVWGDNPSLLVEALVGEADQGVLLEMRSPVDNRRYLEYYKWDGTSEILLEMPEDLSGAFWHLEEGEFWAISGGGKRLTVFDGDGRQKYSQNLSGNVKGILMNPQDETSCWYGFEQEELVLWDKPNGQVQTRVTGQINQYENFQIVYSPTGELFLADVEHVWMYGNDQLREMFSFMKEGYFLNKLYGCCFGEDGELLIFTEYEGGLYLFTDETSILAETEEKQEVIIALNILSPGLQKLAARYNQESQKYHVTITVAEEAEDSAEYRRRIQMEMVSGGGPDLVAEWVVNTRECVAQGYLEPLDEFVEDMSPFMETAFASGEVNGALYGVPYECFPYFLAVSPQLTDTSSWTLEQMYEAVRNSPAEVLEYGADGVDIIMACGLHDEGNKVLIDWEKGESHLAEEPFLELLAFAKEYADQGGYPSKEVSERLLDGRIVGEQIVLSEPGQLNRAKSCFDGEALCIGYPRESGNGIYMETSKLYLNHNAGNKAGALDFLQYLLSEEGQLQYAEYASWMRLPVRRSTLQECLDRYQRNVPDSPNQQYDSSGIYWFDDKLDEKQVEQFWWILDNAVPAVFPADAIWFIVDEELQPYFSGTRSAEDAAQALNSRVQLYLDEQK